MKNIINFSNITLIGVDGVGTDSKILKSLIYSRQFLPNAEVKFLTSGHYENVPDYIKLVKIKNLNYDQFSKFCLTELYNYFDTDYMINCHGDGFVVNSSAWSDEFLNYDYIGAPWPSYNLERSSNRWDIVGQSYRQSGKKYRTGNGGFSLRTKKLMKAVSELYKDEYYGIPEDLVICVIMRKDLEDKGFKFTDNINLSGKFSCEATFVDGYILSSDSSFGFHCGGTHPDKVKLLETV
jgi:hypothetical protein